MSQPRTRRVVVPKVEILEGREAPCTTPWLIEGWEGTPPGTLPAGWSHWSSTSSPSFGASAGRPLHGQTGLATGGASNLEARTWLDTQWSSRFGAGAAIYLDSLVPVRVLARGSDLASATPTYYAISLTRGLEVQLVRVVRGAETVLGSLRSTGYFSGKWVQATLCLDESRLRVEIIRPDTGQYLSGAGTWQAAPAWALDLSDTAITGAGRAGIGRVARYAGTVAVDDFTVVGPGVQESFDQTTPGQVPAGWSRWSSGGADAFAVSTARSFSAPAGLATTAISNVSARAWFNSPVPADVQASALIYADTLIPVQVLARGTGLNTATPSFYAVSLARGLDVQLVRVVNGVATPLASVQSSAYFSGRWVRVTFSVHGSTQRARIFRPDTGQYLNASGQWGDLPAWALSASDAAITGVGHAGLGRAAGYGGTAVVDDFAVSEPSGDDQPPVVQVLTPADGATVSGVVPVRASAADASGILRVDFLVDGVLSGTDAAAPYEFDFDSHTVANGPRRLTVRAYDAEGNAGQAAITVTVANAPVPLPAIPRHYSHIRIAQLAYFGNPLGAFEDDLLRNSVDLVVPNPNYLGHINGVAPATPQLIYTNVSNLYMELFTDWLSYADRNGLSREAAFYHAARPVPFSGDSASSIPVTWFWSVYRGGQTLTDLTSASRSSTPGDVAFAAAGEALSLGYPERFREINVQLASGAAAGWASVLEYVTAVDANGRPTQWAPLAVLSDGTGGLTGSGRITFDPPADWKAATLGSRPARLFYVRFRTTAAGTAPVAGTLLGRDYASANGRTRGTIPAFDPAADGNGDGYLDDAEYARRAAGKDARFLYESRMFYPGYGQMRFATNPASLPFRDWAADHLARFLAGHPLADGLFVDNATGLLPVRPADVRESVAFYSRDHAGLLADLGRRLAPHWLLANTVGGGASADAVVGLGTSYLEEFAIRALAHNYTQFEHIADLVARRAGLRSPAPYAVIDSYPTGGSPTDARTQLATLAYYHLIGDPELTFLMFFGGFEPASPWARHWSPAAGFDIGRPLGAESVFASGTDPINPSLTYRVYGRSFENALVLYKPLSYGNGSSGLLADATATAHALGGTYRPLRADGTLGAPVSSVTLRNGEGAILIRTAP